MTTEARLIALRDTINAAIPFACEPHFWNSRSNLAVLKAFAAHIGGEELDELIHDIERDLGIGITPGIEDVRGRELVL